MYVTNPLERHVAISELLQQLRADGEQVGAGELADLAGVAEGCAHHLCRVAELLVVVVDPSHRGYARVVLAFVGLLGARYGPGERLYCIVWEELCDYIVFQ